MTSYSAYRTQWGDMPLEDDFLHLLNLVNETLAAAIVVIATSMLLYNLTRNIRDRVARTSGAVLASVTASYVVDVLLALEPGPRAAESVLRMQWLGIAFIPAAIFHLSDALLDTTGLPSRGRRRGVSRLLYAIALIFVLIVTFTDLLVHRLPDVYPVSLRAGPVFVIFIAYFVIANIVAFINVDRARKRCLTAITRRRMSYLQATILYPALAIFPYSVFLPAGAEFSLPALILVTLANVLVVLMLLFLSYPLSFFGSRIPDRVVKVELLRFMLRGPATGLLILATIMIFARPAAQIIGIQGDKFTPFAVVAVVLFWQWMVDLSLPWLEKRLVYPDEDNEQFNKIQSLNRHLLPQADLTRLIEAILASSANYLQVDQAFVARLNDIGEFEIVRAIRSDTPIEGLSTDSPDLVILLKRATVESPARWKTFWMLPLYSRRIFNGSGPRLIGVMGVEARGETLTLTEDEIQTLDLLRWRAARTLDDMAVQSELYATLEGLLPQITASRERDDRVEYKPGRQPLTAATSTPTRDEIIEQVQAALRHYWGGPGMTDSRLLELNVVRSVLAQNDNNPVKALRSVLDRAIENQKPAGERDLKSQEWLIYNILYLRFIKGRKVRETANMLYMSEPNLYRKQSLAIEAVADAILQMERETV